MYASRTIALICFAFAFLVATALPAMADENHMAGGDHMAGGKHMASGDHMADGKHMASESVAATGTVNSVDAAEKKVNITHEPIPALDWPGMTMDFPLGDGASLKGIESGTKVTFHLRKEASGAYVIESLSALGK